MLSLVLLIWFCWWNHLCLGEKPPKGIKHWANSWLTGRFCQVLPKILAKQTRQSHDVNCLATHPGNLCWNPPYLTIAKPGAKARKVARCMKIGNDPPRSKPEAKIAGSWRVGWLVGFQKERNIASNTCWLRFFGWVDWLILCLLDDLSDVFLLSVCVFIFEWRDVWLFCGGGGWDGVFFSSCSSSEVGRGPFFFAFLPQHRHQTPGSWKDFGIKIDKV